MKIIIFFAAFLIGGFKAVAQNDNVCAIYRIALDSLYSWSSRYTVDTAAANYPIDPQNPPKDKDQKLATFKEDYIVNLNHIIVFSKSDLTNWFADLVNQPNLLKNQRNLIEKKISCDFNIPNFFENSNYCVKINSEDYDIFDYTSYFECEKNKGKKEKNVGINPSSLILTKDEKTAYFYFLKKEGNTKAETSRWAFILKKTNKNWVITKMAAYPID